MAKAAAIAVMARQTKKPPPATRGQGRTFWIVITAAVVGLVAALVAVPLLRDANGESDSLHGVG